MMKIISSALFFLSFFLWTQIHKFSIRADGQNMSFLTNHRSRMKDRLAPEVSLSSLIQTMGIQRSNQGIMITGETSSSFTGYCATIGGDINGDGYADIVIGAPSINSNTGKVYVVFGSSTLSNIALATLSAPRGFVITGEAVNYRTGTSVSLGNVNSDGLADILIGAPGYGTDTGKIYIIYGASTFTNINLATYTGGFMIFGEVGTCAGTSVSFWGNGITLRDDILIGAPGSSSTMGKAYVLYSGPMSSSFTLGTGLNRVSVINGESISAATGFSVATNGDVDNDGNNDFLIGARNYSSNTGRVYLLSGYSMLPSPYTLATTMSAGITITGEAPGTFTGCSVSMGDVNGDGFGEMLIGACGYNGNSGKAYVIYGGKNWGTSIALSSLTSGQGFTITGGSPGSYLGKALTIGGDVDGDTLSDMFISAYGALGNTGVVYLIYGRSTFSSNIDVNYLTLAQGIMILGETTGYNTGFDVSIRGDVNGDGKADMLLSATGYGSDTGILYLLYGSSSLFNVPLLSPYPSSQPSSRPSMQPTSQPSMKPSGQPTSQPTLQPFGIPTSQPSRQPTNQPTSQPSSQPTSQPK